MNVLRKIEALPTRTLTPLGRYHPRLADFDVFVVERSVLLETPEGEIWATAGSILFRDEQQVLRVLPRALFDQLYQPCTTS